MQKSGSIAEIATKVTGGGLFLIYTLCSVCAQCSLQTATCNVNTAVVCHTLMYDTVLHLNAM